MNRETEFAKHWPRLPRKLRRNVNALVGLHAMKRVRHAMVNAGRGNPREDAAALAAQAHNYRKELETLIERVTR